MQRTVKIKLPENQDLITTLEISSIITQSINDVGNIVGTYNKGNLHKLTYKKLRKAYPFFPSGLLQTVRDVASEQLKRNKLKKSKFKQFTSLRMDKRNLRVNLEHKIISISSINGRLKLNFSSHKQLEKFRDWKAVAGTLSYKKNKLFLNLVVEKKHDRNIKKFKKVERGLFLGIDRGINNIIVCNNNLFVNSKRLKNIKGRYQYLKKVLQKKDTKSAKRKIKKISGKEKRFVSDTNHCLTKQLVNSDFKIFVLENLGIEKKKKNGKKFNKKLGSWSYKQFSKYLEYKSEEKDKVVVYVKPDYTSQDCSKCGFRKKSNRNGNQFKCKRCGFELHSDLNASRNIVNIGISNINRLSVNQPNVALKKSYKPIISMVGS